jgi:mannitol-1-phosphate 5-dehydrogenase
MADTFAVHFGAGNIGRGFIGEVLVKNGFHVDFIDVNETIINELQKRKQYDIALASPNQERITIQGVDGINNKRNPEKVIAAIEKAHLVTTAIGPNILPFIAELIAQGVMARAASGSTEPLDIIACENMIGASEYLQWEVYKYLANKDYADRYIGFPNAAVDRIVPLQKHEDVLFVSVEPFREWVIDDSKRKAKTTGLTNLEGVHYAENLQPYIERKLFTVNTGHATVAYTGRHYGYKTIGEAIRDTRVLGQLRNVLAETGALLINKWHFDKGQHEEYIDTIITRFQNPFISDDISRVARTPMRKLGAEERFIRPIREAKERGLAYQALLETTAYIFDYDDQTDEESVNLQRMIRNKIGEVVKMVTGLCDEDLVGELVEAVV